ncbi:claudin-13-like [Peromyscus leucopus]|uniref:claudin-13-like n=1 Tax=Peromyscus leucopus TaxID=10041 RepID=UPI0010A1D098|nr:claudin-13-like [Peromyscus leucopus]
MGRPELEAASFSLAMLGWLVAIISCGLPLWRVKKVSEETNILEGLWNLCEAEGVKSLRCMSYNTRPVQPQDLQVSGVLVVICIVITWLGLLLYMIGDERIGCVANMYNEEKIMIAASGLFLGVGLLLLVSVSWVTHNVLLGIANPQILSPWKPEMGASLYLGWLSSLLLLLGGALLGGAHLCCPPPNNDNHKGSFRGLQP